MNEVSVSYSFDVIKEHITRYFPFDTVLTYIFVVIGAILTFKALSGLFKGLTGNS